MQKMLVRVKMMSEKHQKYTMKKSLVVSFNVTNVFVFGGQEYKFVIKANCIPIINEPSNDNVYGIILIYKWLLDTCLTSHYFT